MTTTAVPSRANALEFRSLKDLRGYKVSAGEGEFGTVVDFYFDDVTWDLRYFVVEAGGWLDRRRMLLSPLAFTTTDGRTRTISTRLTRRQIENAPRADLAKPVSRQFEIKLHEYFAWPMYWINDPGTLQGPKGDSHLRSIDEVLGYRIQASDGEIGHVEDLIAAEREWRIRYLAIDTRNWLPGRKVIIDPVWIESVNWADNTVAVSLNREQIKDSPAYDPSQPVNRSYEERLYDYYGRPRYWDV